MIAHSDTKRATETAFITQSDLRLEDKDGKNPEMQEIWGLQRLWGHPLGRNTSVGNQNIYNGTWLEYDDAVSRLHVVIAYCYGNSSNAA